MINRKEIKKIIIFRYRFIGDTVLTIPFIKNVKEYFPDAQIDVLVSPNSGELIEGNPDVNKIIYFDNSKFHKYENIQEAGSHDPASLYCNSFLGCVKVLKRENYELAFVLKRSFSSAFLAFLSRAKYRVGFNTEFRSFLLTHKIKYDKSIHEIDNFLNCLKPLLDITPQRHMPKIYTTQKEEIKANGFLVRLDRFKPKVLIHASSAHPYKMWPKRYFAKLMDYLYDEFGAQFVFTGAKIDKEAYEKILGWCENKNKFKILDLLGLTSIRECYSIYKGLDLAVCVDSGNAHISAASGIPTYVLYGPTRPERWLPLGKSVFPLRLNQLLPCQPCDVKVECSHLSCMKLLSPEFIFSNLKNGKIKVTT
ncbi:MAG: glycosyltransferase family 9 protein [Candidatus Melainabacteria bacterium]|nr:glycosyltransferase family 9 protein [Candidatus Melainabacteria bacterium]